jgi:hypothetical protein
VETQNQTFIILATLLTLAFLATLGLVAFVIYRKMVRRNKDIERSLKMVPLQIKLPPAEASESSNRDTRELFKENISKAEGIFNLLSGITADKSHLYGNRYLSFEIIADGAMIYFYTAVPVTLLSTVQKALVSGYPTIQIEQIDDPNIFSQTSKLAGVSGGELVLANDSYFPIATYKSRDSDPLAGILSSLSRLQSGEGAGIQIMIRPAKPVWAKNAKKKAKDLLDPEKIAKEKYTTKKLVRDIAMAPIKQPGYSKKMEEGTLKQDNQPDAINQKMSQLVEEKYAAPAFDKDDIINTPNLYAAARLISRGAVTPPFSLKEIFPPIGVANPQLYDQMVQLSRQQFARPKADVAAEIAHSLAVVPSTPQAKPGTPVVNR